MLTHVVRVITTVLQYVKVPSRLSGECFPNIPHHRLVSPHYKYFRSPNIASFLFIHVEKEYISVRPVMVTVLDLRERENYKRNSVALVRKRTIPTERPPLVGEGSAIFCG
jgi:hypothetical protein